MFVDFIIKYDPEKDTQETVAKKVIKAIFLNRLKANKPVVTFIGGDSGEGKSFTVLKLQEVLMELQGMDLKDFVNDCNVYIPIEYPQKFDKILGLSNDKAENKRLRWVNMIAIHEARDVIKAKMWYSFLNQAIGDINAMSRSIKRMAIFVVSQFIRDIDPSIRYTLTYYCKVFRPRGQHARLYINVIWKDDSDLEKPRLRKRKLSGYLVYPNGRYRKYQPEYLELTKPSKEIVDRFEHQDLEAKKSVLRKKIDKLIKEMKMDLDVESGKIPTMVDYYTKNIEQLSLIGKRNKTGFKLKPEVKVMHELTDNEAKEFQDRLNSKLRTMKIWSKEDKEQYEQFQDEELESIER